MSWKRPSIPSLIVILLGLLISYTFYIPSALAQDPGQPDSMIIGNLDGSLIMTDIADQVRIPVWVKTDDSVTFMHLPVASDNNYFSSRSGGELFPPLSLWDDVEFLSPNSNTGNRTNQSILAYAFTAPPRDPQNFLYTDYQWVHIADFFLNVVSDPGIYGDTTCLSDGFNPFYGWLLWSLQDGVTQFDPVTVYNCVTFVSNIMPVFQQPPADTELAINQGFPYVIDVVVTDADVDNVDVTVNFPGSNYTFQNIQNYPGYTHKRFRWVPGTNAEGQFPAVFTANDHNGGIVTRTITLDVTPSSLYADNFQILSGAEVDFPINLRNNGVNSLVGGFEILLSYDDPMLCLTEVTRCARLSEWEYFHYSVSDTATIRVVGLADLTGMGNSLPPGDGPLFKLHFQINNGDEYIGQYGWVHFVNGDNNDNTLSDSTGYMLIHPSLQDGWIYVVDPDEILIADINLNTFAWEISDAVIFSNYLVDPDVCPLSPVQLLATDTNGDHNVATIADLIYLLRVILGVVSPPKINYGVDPFAYVTMEKTNSPENGMGVNYYSDIPAGGLLVRVNHRGFDIGEVTATSDMSTQISDRNGILSVLIYSMDGDIVNPGTRLFEIASVPQNASLEFSEIQVSDNYGNVIPAEGRIETNLPLSCRLTGAYPNPFNASTTIGFSLPVAGNVEIAIYNIMGQLVKSLNADNMPPGENSLVWDGTDGNGNTVASGVYMYRLTVGDYSATSRMTLLK